MFIANASPLFLGPTRQPGNLEETPAPGRVLSVDQALRLNPSPQPVPKHVAAKLFEYQYRSAVDDALRIDVARGNAPYAEVRVNGEVVARLDNSGASETWGSAAGLITGEGEPFGPGPELAQWRAERIARALGGTVVKADTAISQQQWSTEAREAAGRAEAQEAEFQKGLAAYLTKRWSAYEQLYGAALAKDA